jgi:hypothetical protein
MRPVHAVVLGTFLDWKVNGVRWIGLRDGLLAESFKLESELADAKARGLEIVSVDDVNRTGAAIVRTLERASEMTVGGVSG